MRRQWGNLTLLVGSYAAGQGSLFVSQTWLITTQQHVRLTEFGISFFAATLFLIIVDFGSTSYIARDVLSARPANSILKARDCTIDSNTDCAIRKAFWHVTPIRLTAAIILSIASIFYGREAGGFIGMYLMASTGGILAWSFNALGILDGLRKSGLSGISSAILFVTSAAALALTANHDPETAGFTMGIALSVSCIASVLFQICFTRMSGARLRISRVSRHGLIDALANSGSSMLTLIPGQLYYRFQLAICAAYLPPVSMAMFLYVKQIVIALVQLVGFIRRVEFANTVSLLEEGRTPTIKAAFLAQWVGTAAAALGAFGAAAFGAILHVLGPDSLRSAGTALMVFAPTVLTSALSLACTQACMAMRRFRLAAGISVGSVVVGALASISFAPPLGLPGIALSDVAAATATMAAFAFFLKRQTRLVRP
jgi:O-antigen/teichoic acid export membrane protein